MCQVEPGVAFVFDLDRNYLPPYYILYHVSPTPLSSRDYKTPLFLCAEHSRKAGGYCKWEVLYFIFVVQTPSST